MADDRILAGSGVNHFFRNLLNGELCELSK